MLRRAVAVVEGRDVRATAEMPLDHSAANGLMMAAERHAAELVVLNWGTQRV